VVDDDRLVLATVTHGLAQAGFEVIDADNGDDAILLAREHRPDLALLDIRMEGKTGFDVADYLRESLGTPFMFLSAFADSATVERVRELGAVAYLVKPLDVAQIVPTVEAAVSNVRKGAAHRPVLAASPSAPALAPVAAPAAPRELLSDPLPLAVGVLMHRYSITRHQALERLQRLADADGRPLAMHAAALVDAAELLARHAD
jgi:two-component system, response regulator PdtaR